MSSTRSMEEILVDLRKGVEMTIRVDLERSEANRSDGKPIDPHDLHELRRRGLLNWPTVTTQFAAWKPVKLTMEGAEMAKALDHGAWRNEIAEPP